VDSPEDRPAGAATPSYSLGHSEQELARLRVQARLIDPITRRFFVEAGIRPGMRVLDVGSGAGDVAFIAADLVGPTGEVIGTDRAQAALDVATQRAEKNGRANVSFRAGDPAELVFDHAFDAVIGRYVLMFQPDPAAMLRQLLVHVRRGGLVVFHEPYRGGTRSFPPVAAYDQGWHLVDETFRRSGADPLMGIKLHATFLAAGLPAPTMRLEAVIAGGASASDQVHFEMDVARTLLPEMKRLGVATAADDEDVAQLPDRVLDEAAATESVIVGRAEIAAWASTPG
jgi:2-polyprenyl-3-methyl-5-hydroxy-6-metoxy-1,4-benzoquinol methylase